MAPPPSTSHTRKRQYQPSVDSYFQRTSSAPPAPLNPTSSPPLPADTQASLLSVGMRVRKSVPEGYKTHKTLIGPAAHNATAVTAATGAVRYHLPTSSAPAPGPGSRELTPFCGLHKIGGWAMPPGTQLPQSSAPAAVAAEGWWEDDEDGDERKGGVPPRLTMSQGTIGSMRGSFGMGEVGSMGSKKRGYEEEVEAEMDAFFDDMDAADDDVADGVGAPTTSHRTIAKLRARGNKLVGNVTVKTFDSDDFPEAVFLSPMEVDQ